jgi:hypothetical protein
LAAPLLLKEIIDHFQAGSQSQSREMNVRGTITRRGFLPHAIL